MCLQLENHFVAPSLNHVWQLILKQMDLQLQCNRILFATVFIESKDDDKEEKELPCLDRFLAKNTSEDNASFEHIMDLASDKEKLRHSWLYDAEAEYKQVGFFTN